MNVPGVGGGRGGFTGKIEEVLEGGLDGRGVVLHFMNVPGGGPHWGNPGGQGGGDL